ncbi:cytochrome c-type biogenesis protein [Kordiimonas pumila]|uniref:Cytochrome c-type biogenesis protein n=1 Tax=Kordiimonas pumila TaxID=2161677 RepID=A0ABV7D441_9PROT|nr:cytochrome c-type biogenesis protein [Kordiimonas pumila]
MRRLFSALILVVSVALPLLAVAVDEKPLADPRQEAVARSLMKEIRCLVCQNQSIEDSNADLAKDLRQVVRERVAIGDSPKNVRAYLVDRYGDWVLLEPPFKKSTYFLWLSPFLFLLAIGIGILLARRRHTVPPAPLSTDEQVKLNALLDSKESRK